MKKIFLFDLDGTIAEKDKAIPYDLMILLRKMSSSVKIIFISGKPSCYIYGLLRQAGGFSDISVIGENGATISIGSHFPPDIYYKFEIDKISEKVFKSLEEFLVEKFKDEIWFQPNEINLTVFPKNLKLMDELYNIFISFSSINEVIYRHVDSIEMVPRLINKRVAVEKFLTISGLNIKDYEIHAFGDNTNDLPMFELADYIYIVGGKIKYDKACTVIRDTFELSNILEEYYNTKIKGN